MICLHNDSQLLSTVKESNSEVFRAPNIRQTASRVQYMCVVLTDRSEKKKKRESLPIQLTKWSVRREHVIAKAARPCKNRRQNACMTLTLGRGNKRVWARISLWKSTLVCLYLCCLMTTQNSLLTLNILILTLCHEDVIEIWIINRKTSQMFN
jgi:hypothetical protein